MLRPVPLHAGLFLELHIPRAELRVALGPQRAPVDKNRHIADDLLCSIYETCGKKALVGVSHYVFFKWWMLFAKGSWCFPHGLDCFYFGKKLHKSRQVKRRGKFIVFLCFPPVCSRIKVKLYF